MAALEKHRMALLLDIVPNHMGVGSDNHWWMDVLENGEASLYSKYFDINWQPLQPELRGRVLLPVLGDHYGRVLENGELRLFFDGDAGTFSIRCVDNLFPVAPRSYQAVLEHDLQRLEDRLGAQHNGYLELRNLISSFANLPDRSETMADKLQTRYRNKEVNKRMLARLCRETPEVRQFIEENVILFNGDSGRPESYDLLHDLLEGQAYRLAYWRVAADEINYRRFFDINDLAGLRMENKEVFDDTHRLVLDLVSTGKLDGVRVDHPDGLYDPGQYFCRLQRAAAGELADDYFSAPAPEDGEQKKAALYVVVEKILADFENLPADWPVNGSTGYDFASLVGGLFVDAEAEDAMTALYHRFIGGRLDFAELVYQNKKLIIRVAMAGELNVLTSMLYRIAQASRHTRDFTLNRLREALTEIVACFPVYRTYIASGSIMKSDTDIIDRAVAEAAAREQLEDAGVFDFIGSVLLLRNVRDEHDLQSRLVFVKKLQQYTGPVMAKGFEDTSFYIYNRLLSLNEVGGNPNRFGVSLAAFHRANQDRQRHWPHAMINSSTHDSKRSEDVRARINVLSEMVREWEQKILLWNTQHHALKTHLDGMTAPAKNDEYAFYQNLLGAWPPALAEGEARQGFIARMNDCMLKTIREAKEHTSWINPDAAYEQAMTDFITGVLARESSWFQDDFLPFQEEVAWFGMLNSLSQVLLKLTSPGVPDIYQGNEIWRFCLVDPDNRRPVDFEKRRNMLDVILEKSVAAPAARSDFLKEMLDSMADGRAKMYITALLLQCRKSWWDAFAQGAYLPLEVKGAQREHLCAFARKHGERLVVVAAPRLFRKLMQGERTLPLGEDAWGDTAVMLPEDAAGLTLENLFTGEKMEPASLEKPNLKAARILRSWPVGLLLGGPAGRS
jgi:(1->4)-alpha-D-glucan 1-alpha-D-glucosylmutase